MDFQYQFQDPTNLTNITFVYKNLTSVTSTSTLIDCGGMESWARKYTLSYHLYLAITICIFGTMANVLNIIVLTRKTMASMPINQILTALAVADMLLMIEYIPYAYYYYNVVLKNYDFPYLGAVFMLFHSHFTQILHTISICLTLTLAIWRYLALGYPENHHVWCSQSRCTFAIALSCCLPAILCFPTYFTMTIQSQRIHENNEYYTLYNVGITELIKNDPKLLMANFWIYAVFIKLLPCCILTIITVWLIRTLFKAKKRKQVLREYDTVLLTLKESRNNGKEAKVSSKAERRADRTTKMLIAVLFLFLLTEFPQGIFAVVIGLKGKNLFQECYQVYGEVLDMLALINGAINFILYCYMNRMFRTTFGQLFRPKILDKFAVLMPHHSENHSTETEFSHISEITTEL